MNLDIKKMFENGLAIKRIAKLLNLKEVDIKNEILVNNWSLQKEDFNDKLIPIITDLYKQGVSAKQLGIKYSIDKRRIQNWVEAAGFLRDKNSSHRFTEFNQHVFDIIDTKEKAYWLGFLYADSYNCDTVNTVILSLKYTDLLHLEKFSDFLQLPKEKISLTITKEGHKYHTVKAYSKYLSERLTELGCPRAKSFIINFPYWLDKRFIKSFILGYFDGDGSIKVTANTKEWSINICSTKEMLESIRNIINNININSRLSYISETNNNTWLLDISGNEQVRKFCEWIYQDSSIFLNRKYDRYLKLCEQQESRTFIKNDYKVLKKERIDIISEINSGKNVIDVANLHKLHPRTINYIKKEKVKESKFSDVVEINNQPITAKYVKTLDYDEREALVEPLFQHFRNQGWIFPDDSSKLQNSWKKLCDFNPNLNDNELFNNNSMSTDICKYFCHSFYDSTEKNKETMIEVFNDDLKLKRLIRNRLGFDWWDKEDNDETFNISFRMLIQGLRSSRLVPSITIFKPSIAKFICMKYSEEGDMVGDYSCGFGARLLGAMSCNRQYIGTDPLTVPELENMANFFNFNNYKLIQLGSENYRGEENSIDLYWSSPPYFDQEAYSSDLSQAYNNGEDYFYNVYWKKTLENIKHMLKPNKWFGLNVKNYPKMLNMAQEYFGDIKEQIGLRTIRSHLNKSAGIEKYEYIYMFKNIK